MEPSTVVQHAGYRIEIHVDDNPQNPRTDYGNFGTMVCFHGKYTLGDPPEEHGYRSSDYHRWEGLQEAIEKNHPGCILLPIYLYDHSGLTINTTGFSCPWDSGQIGFIFAAKEAIRQQFMVRAVTGPVRARALAVLEGEVETYDQYLRGDIYGYEIKRRDPDEEGKDTGEGELLESCWGFYGEGCCLEEAKGVAEGLEEEGTT